MTNGPASPENTPPPDTHVDIPVTNPEQTINADVVKADNVVLGGIKRVVTRVREIRAEQLEDKANALRDDLEVKQNSAKRLLIPGRPRTERGSDHKVEDARVTYGYHVPKDLTESSASTNEGEEGTERIVVRSLRPETRAQRRAAKKADRKLRGNMSKAVVNSYTTTGLILPTNEDEAEPGTDAYTEVVDTGRFSPSERRAFKKAAKRTQRNKIHIKSKVDQVKRMADGTDKPGAKQRERIAKLEAKKERHLTALGRAKPNSPSTTPKVASTLDPMSDSIKGFGNPERDPLKGESRTEQAVNAALAHLSGMRIGTKLELEDVEEMISTIGDTSPALVKFTFNKLVRLGVLNAHGNIIEAHDRVENILKTVTSTEDSLSSDALLNGVIEHTPRLSLTNDQLDSITQLRARAVAAYNSSLESTTNQTQKAKEIRSIEDSIIKSVIGSKATPDDIQQVKNQIHELAQRRARTATRSETPEQRKTRKEIEIAAAAAEAEAQLEADWAWAGEEKPGTSSTPDQDPYEELKKTNPNA